MSALVKLTSISRQSGYIRLEAADGVSTRATGTGMGLQVSGGKMLSATGEDAGSEVDAIRANKRGIIHMGTISPSRYQVLVEVHPDLHMLGSVGHARIIEPGDSIPLDIYINAHRAVDVSALEWTVRLYMID
jgi:hypothetical protein